MASSLVKLDVSFETWPLCECSGRFEAILVDFVDHRQ